MQKVTCETQRTLSSLRCEPHIFPQCTRNSSWPSVRPAATFAPRAMRGFSPSPTPAINIIFRSIPGRGRGSTEKRKGHKAGSLQETGILLLLRVRKYAAFASSRSDVRRMGEKRQKGGREEGRRVSECFFSQEFAHVCASRPPALYSFECSFDAMTQSMMSGTNF